MMPKVPRRPGAQAASQATRARRKKRRQFGSQADLCRMLPCCGCRPFDFAVAISQVIGGVDPTDFRRLSDPDHWRTRGAGGTDEDCIPLCAQCHAKVDGINSGRKTYATAKGLNPADALAMVRGAVKAWKAAEAA